MSFTVPAPTPDSAEADIISSAFWPAIQPASIRSAQRIDNAILQERLRTALVEAISTVNTELASWRALREAEGHNTLAAVPAETIDGTSIHIHRYQRAVGCLAKAAILERSRDLDTTAKGDREAEATDPTIDDLRRDARWAITDIIGIGRTTVELI